MKRGLSRINNALGLYLRNQGVVEYIMTLPVMNSQNIVETQTLQKHGDELMA